MASFIKIIKRIAYIVLGWIFVLPFGLMFPKKKNLILIIGRQDGRFVDNTKYFTIYLTEKVKEKNVDFFYLTSNKQWAEELELSNIPHVLHPSLKSLISLLRAQIVITDDMEWAFGFKYFLLIRSKKIQLWHGVGFKYIQLMNRKTTKILNISITPFLRLMGTFPKYDLLISTSRFYTKHLFSKAFRFRKIIETGYPRNDIFFQKDFLNKHNLIGTDKKCIEKIQLLKEKGSKIIIYTPTFRGISSNTSDNVILNFDELNNFSKSNNCIFVIKFHPLIKDKTGFSNYENLLIYNSTKDVYPLLPLTDMLITDYSSIYMDYLFLNKPIVFFPYDYEFYINYESGIQFDYDWITPGDKCYTQQELQTKIKEILFVGKDHYMEKRRQIRDIAFKYLDGKSSERIWHEIKNIS